MLVEAYRPLPAVAGQWTRQATKRDLEHSQGDTVDGQAVAELVAIVEDRVQAFASVEAFVDEPNRQDVRVIPNSPKERGQSLGR